LLFWYSEEEGRDELERREQRKTGIFFFRFRVTCLAKSSRGQDRCIRTGFRLIIEDESEVYS
jgi:hypothetical protein